MITNFLFFVAFVAVAYLTTCMSARPPLRARIRVRSGRTTDAGRN
ncbi:MAG TPA: hypothetical protein VG734_09310 [Lacunisphaera sp.]|nr:hypothetical protein [Lacunisphaera sp.]